MIPDSLVNYLSLRLEQFEILSSHGLVPGCMDSIEYHEVRGRIKELKRVLDFIGDMMLKDLHMETNCDYNAHGQATK